MLIVEGSFLGRWEDRLERFEGPKFNLQRLLTVEGQVAQDEDLLADLVTLEQPQLMLLRSQPCWAGGI